MQTDKTIHASTEFRYFPTSEAAWAFMRECDKNGIAAGYPSLNDNGGNGYSVQILK